MTRRALLIHGLSSNSRTWWRVAAALEAEGWEVATPDLRGHGEAPRRETYSFDDYASDLPAGPWDLIVGHSLGGAVAIVAASNTARLVLLDPVLEVRPDEFQQVKHEQLAELDLSEETIRRAKPLWSELDLEIKIEAMRQADRAAVERTFTDNSPWNVIDRATALSVPTLILGGDPEVSTMLPVETANAVAEANPFVEYRIVRGAGHSVHRDRPAETIAAILDWANR